MRVHVVTLDRLVREFGAWTRETACACGVSACIRDADREKLLALDARWLVRVAHRAARDHAHTASRGGGHDGDTFSGDPIK